MTHQQYSSQIRPGLFAIKTPGDVVRFIPRVFMSLLDLLLTWQERAEQRYHLASLGDHLLSDMGIDRADADREVTKPFWRA